MTFGEQRGTGNASGKVILLGEHAAVYGHPALALGIGRGATAHALLSTGARDESTLTVRPFEKTCSARSDEPLGRAFAALLVALDVPSRVEVQAELRIAGGAGLGSSAALGVAVLRAIDDAVGVARTEDEAHRLSMVWERVFHGNPSGVDSALALSGGVGFFVRGEPLLRVRCRRPFYLTVANSLEPSSTAAMVDEVGRRYARDRARLDKHFAAIGALVSNGRLALEAGDMRALGQLMDMNQSLLAALLVSTSKLEEMIAIARGEGALGAKLTGGGGGGCMIALADAPERAERIAEALSSFEPFVVGIGAPREAE